MEETHCFLVNPAAGGGYAGRHWPRAEEKLKRSGLRYRYLVSERRGDIRALVQEAFTGGHRRFVAVGGDGTANELLNGLMNAAGPEAVHCCLACLPWGTGNDWARYHGFSRDVEALILSLQCGNCRPQDVGRVSCSDAVHDRQIHYFLNCAGTGFDSFLLANMKAARGSRLRYLVQLLKCLRRYRAAPLQIRTEGESLVAKTLLLEVCLGEYAGAGMRFAPAARADDGLFDVLLVEDLGVRKILGSLRYLYNGKIQRHPAATGLRCRSISISARTGQHLHCDGEIVAPLPVDIDLLPQAVGVMTPTARPPADRHPAVI